MPNAVQTVLLRSASLMRAPCLWRALWPLAFCAPFCPALPCLPTPPLGPACLRSWDATAAPRPTLLHEHVGHIDWVRVGAWACHARLHTLANSVVWREACSQQWQLPCRLHTLAPSPCFFPQVNDLALAGDVLVSCSNDRTVRVWQPDSPGARQAAGQAGGGWSVVPTAQRAQRCLRMGAYGCLAVCFMLLPTSIVAVCHPPSSRPGAGLPHRPLRLRDWAGGLGGQQHAGQRRPARRGAAVGPGCAAARHDRQRAGEQGGGGHATPLCLCMQPGSSLRGRGAWPRGRQALGMAVRQRLPKPSLRHARRPCALDPWPACLAAGRELWRRARRRTARLHLRHRHECCGQPGGHGIHPGVRGHSAVFLCGQHSTFHGACLPKPAVACTFAACTAANRLHPTGPQALANLIDARSGQVVMQLKGHTDNIRCAPGCLKLLQVVLVSLGRIWAARASPALHSAGRSCRLAFPGRGRSLA